MASQINRRLLVKAKSRTFCCGKHPRFLPYFIRWLGFQGGFGFILRYDNNRVFRGSGLSHTFLLRGRQYLLVVLAFAGSTNNMIAWGGDGYFIVTENKRELTLPQKLLVLPAIYVIVGAQTRKPVGNESNCSCHLSRKYSIPLRP